MNIRVKMPFTGRNIGGSGMVKELLMTVIATTLSIVLTFGTAQYFEHRQKLHDGRQLAIMTIHDIDNSVEMMQNYIAQENDRYGLAQYYMEHLDSLATAPGQYLDVVRGYLLATSENFTLDVTSEQIFLSSQEAWDNIDNPAFIDAVQSFYNDRHGVINYLNTSIQWRKPLSEEENWEQQIKAPNFIPDYVTILNELLRRDEVRYYITFWTIRQQRIKDIITRWENISNQCKMLMGITDSEIEEYSSINNRLGEQASEQQLLGVWRGKSQSQIMNNERENQIELRKDHSGTVTIFERESHALYQGQVTKKMVIPATWELIGDSLFITQKPKVEVFVDTTGITYSDEHKEEVLKWIDFLWEEERSMRDYQNTLGDMFIRYFLCIDRSGTKIELIRKAVGSDGTEYYETRFLTKEE